MISKIKSLTFILLLFPAICWSQSAVTNQKLFDTLSVLPEHYTERVAQFETEAIQKGKIIFLGNSITEMGKWKILLMDSTVINRGIGGDITYGILKRLDDVIQRAPSKLFILIGINDISKDIPDVVIADNYRKILERVREGSPKTKIYIQSVLPLDPMYPGFPQHYDKQTHVLSLNKQLKVLADHNHCTFINLYPLFLNSKQTLDRRYTIDGLHLNEKGYQVWIKYLKERKYL